MPLFVRFWSCLAILLLLLNPSFIAAPTPSPMGVSAAELPGGLHVDANTLRDANDQPVRLLGVNRAGTEYACIQGWGIFDGPATAASVQAIASWGATAVRVPLNETCWLGINGASAQYSGANYRNAIANYVTLLNQHGLVAILELHWSAPGSGQATGLQPMPNRDHSIAFWQSVAAAYKNNDAVVFELFNEPAPDNNANSAAAWDCWKNGTTATNVAACPGSFGGFAHYEAAGMQELVNAVRGTGATNLILLGGVGHSARLSGWLANKPSDPLAVDNIAAAWHVYNNSQCNLADCWDTEAGPLAAQVPLVTTEIGEKFGISGPSTGTNGSACTHTFIDLLMNWLDARGASYLAWTWNTWSDCLALITDYNGTPTVEYGRAFKEHLMEVTGYTAPPGGPVINRNVPAYANAGSAGAANDNDYSTPWRSYSAAAPAPTLASPHWIAFDLTGVPSARKAGVVLAWYNDATTNYNTIDGLAAQPYSRPSDYTIEGHPLSATGNPPTSGWTTLVTVTSNTFNGRTHALNLANYSWVRMRFTSSVGPPWNEDVGLQIDIHDQSYGRDSWLFLGDSITAEGFRHNNLDNTAWSNGNVAQLVSVATNGARFPATVNGGISASTASQAAANINFLLSPFSGQFVSINYGTNDANTGQPLTQQQVATYYANLLTIVDAIQSRGMIAVVPYIPWGSGQLGVNTGVLNDYVGAHIFADRPGVRRGPDLWTLFGTRPELLRDGIHPTFSGNPPGTLNGYEEFHRMWRDVILTIQPVGAPPPTVPTGWSEWASQGGVLTESPSAASFGGRLYAFAVGTDPARPGVRPLYVKSSADGMGWSAWRSLGGNLTAAPAAAAFGGRLYVFAKGTDNALYVASSADGAAFSPWRSLGGNLTAPPAAAAFGGRLYVFARGVSGGINPLYVASSADGAAFTPWRSLGGNLTAAPAATAAGGRLYVFARGSDQALWLAVSADGTTWAPWQSLGGVLTAAPTAAAYTLGGVEYLALLVRGTDGAVYARLRVAADHGASFAPWRSLGGETVGPPTAAPLGGRLYVLVRWEDDTLRAAHSTP